MAKILMISTDKRILEEGSSVRNRMSFLAKSVDEMEIVVLGIDSPKQIFGNVSAVGVLRLKALFFKSTGVSVVTAQDPFETGLIALVISRRCGAKLHLQIHTDFLNPYFIKENIKNRIRVIIARFLLPHANGVRVMSDRIKRSLDQGLKVFVLPVFIDKEKIKNFPITIDLHKKYPNFEKIILIASRLTKEKDIPLALLGFKNILQTFPKVGLVIVGSGPEDAFIRTEVMRLGLEKSVAIELWADYPTIISYMKTSDVFLNTSFYEGYGMTLIEASLSGIPVVSTDVGIATEAGAYITDRTPLDVYTKLKEALEKGQKVGKLELLDLNSYLEAYKKSLYLD